MPLLERARAVSHGLLARPPSLPARTATTPETSRLLRPGVGAVRPLQLPAATLRRLGRGNTRVADAHALSPRPAADWRAPGSSLRVALSASSRTPFACCRPVDSMALGRDCSVNPGMMAFFFCKSFLVVCHGNQVSTDPHDGIACRATDGAKKQTDR